MWQKLEPVLIVWMEVVTNGKPKNWGCGAAGSALEWHSRGHGFDPRQLHFELQGLNQFRLGLFIRLTAKLKPF